MTLVLVSRQGCHLCDESLALIRQLGCEPEVVDVDSHDQLHDLYDWRVPVLILDGRVIAEGSMDRAHLQKALHPE
ncbi:MAG: glutaredoxin family protein [Candidatus Dormibacteraceae bacterium]